MSKKPPRLGKLPPMYDFILNSYAETRVGRCPSCEHKMHQRKVPLFIQVGPMHPVILNYTCRYCPDCDLLVAHQNDVEHFLATMFAELDPSVIGNDYLVMGTVERAMWRAGIKTPMSMGELLDNLHDFKRVLQFEYRPAGWYPDKDGTAEERRSGESTLSSSPDRRHGNGPTGARRKKRRQERRSKGSRGR
jgi:thiol-disulfide isomerase/thioredoxin